MGTNIKYFFIPMPGEIDNNMNGNMRMLPKLTDEHIMKEKMNTMRVKMVTQPSNSPKNYDLLF